MICSFFFFFQAEDGIRDAQESRGLGDVYKRQIVFCEMVVSATYPANTAAAPLNSIAIPSIQFPSRTMSESQTELWFESALASLTFPSLTAPPEQSTNLFPVTRTFWLACPIESAYAAPMFVKLHWSKLMFKDRDTFTAPTGSPAAAHTAV
eukprot:TRINITY_DN4489_c0_g1_i2.p2 TRINITY_DN4489_c0_g1~~TRINITY_DN4489_c0_g1_i2.p2  ORF type:complete len:151 (-),score=36.61 TRINITY_DN4489_c0_g1_i2:552-1004(-)